MLDSIMNQRMLKPFVHCVRHFAFMILALLSIPFLSGADQKQQAVMTELEKQTGLSFGAQAKILFHEVDTERLPGLTEWIIKAPGFKIEPQTFPEMPLKMFDNSSLQKMLTLRIKSLKINNPKDSYHVDWKTAAGEKFQCDVLLSDDSPLIYLLKEP
jgi:hypothetical protein